MFNRVILMGRICTALELKTTPNGVTVLSFRLAVDRNYAAKGEERKSDFLRLLHGEARPNLLLVTFLKAG